MKRWLWGLFVVALLAAGAWAAFSLPIGGRTLIERLRGPGATAASAGKAPPAVSDSRPPAAAPAGKEAPGSSDSDRLTEQDRQNLDRLLENRLHGPDGGGKREAP
jgi:hypothetical protein